MYFEIVCKDDGKKVRGITDPAKNMCIPWRIDLIPQYSFVQKEISPNKNVKLKRIVIANITVIIKKSKFNEVYSKEGIVKYPMISNIGKNFTLKTARQQFRINEYVKKLIGLTRCFMNFPFLTDRDISESTRQLVTA